MTVTVTVTVPVTVTVTVTVLVKGGVYEKRNKNPAARPEPLRRSGPRLCLGLVRTQQGARMTNRYLDILSDLQLANAAYAELKQFLRLNTNFNINNAEHFLKELIERMKARSTAKHERDSVGGPQ